MTRTSRTSPRSQKSLERRSRSSEMTYSSPTSSESPKESESKPQTRYSWRSTRLAPSLKRWKRWRRQERPTTDSCWVTGPGKPKTIRSLTSQLHSPQVRSRLAPPPGERGPQNTIDSSWSKKNLVPLQDSLALNSWKATTRVHSVPNSTRSEPSKSG